MRPFIASFALVLVGMGCTPGGDDPDGGNSSSSSSGGSTCLPGEQRACACSNGGQGVQICQADGRSLGACDCSSTGSSSSSWSGNTSSGTISSSSSSGSIPSSSASSSGNTGTSSSSSTSGASGNSSGGGSSSGCGLGSEHASCSNTSDCDCGLSCIANLCLVACAVPGTQDLCGAGRRCVGPIVDDISVCVDAVETNGSCAESPCKEGLECQPSVADPITGDVADEGLVCHEPCVYGVADGGCSGGTRCLPSTAGFVDPQLHADGGVVGCVVDGDPGACDTAAGFACMSLSGGDNCARLVSACGTGVGPANIQPLPDGGKRPISASDVCNLGPTILDTSGEVMIEGSRLCDDYASLPNPPMVSCEPVFSSLPSYAGICVAICSFPVFTGSAREEYDCPAGYFCDEADSLFLGFVRNGGDRVPCTDDGQCSAYPLSTCIDVDVGSRACAAPFGMCQPGSGSSSSSSSSGGASSSFSASSGGGSSSSTNSSSGASFSSSSGGGSSNGGQSSSSAGSSSSSGASAQTILGGACEVANTDGAQCAGADAQAVCIETTASAVTGFCGVVDCPPATTNCAGANTRCIGPAGGTACVDSCNLNGGDGQCGVGGACVNLVGGPVCQPLAFAECRYNEPVTGCVSTSCAPVGTDGFGQCVPSCDLFTQNCQSGADGCYPAEGGPMCFAAGIGPEGSACNFTEDCAKGLFCVGNTSGDACRRYCDDTHQCPSGNCVTVDETTGLGACVP